MRIISKKKIRESGKEHPEWAASLSAWYKIVKNINADWKHFPDLKDSWKNSDSFGTCVVFDISHNKCRLIAFIDYKTKKVFILYILSHAEYLKDRWKNDCDHD